MSAQSYIEHIFLNGVYSGNFDRAYAKKWLEADQLRSALIDVMVQSFKLHGYDVGDRYNEIVDQHFLAMRNTGVFYVDGDEYTGEFLRFEIEDKDTYIKTHIDRIGIGERLERLGGNAIQNALSRIAVEEGWVSPVDTESDLSSGEGNTEREAPASDRVVTFSDNQISELEEQTSEFIKFVEKQNQIGEQPGLREIVIGQLKAGREFIRAGSFKLYLLQVTLLETLQYLARRYEKEAIGGLAASLIAALLKHIGLDI